MSDLIAVSEAFEDLTSGQLRLVEEASHLGRVRLHLWSDELIRQSLGKPPQFPLEERRYWWESCRYVSEVATATTVAQLPGNELPAAWVMGADSPLIEPRRAWCGLHGVRLVAIDPPRLREFPAPLGCPSEPSGKRRVIVTGTFDWFHTGHVRFLEEVAELGDLYVCVGHDANIRLLKGPDRPLFAQNERAYVVGSMKFPTMALVTSGSGWLDAAPEIERLKPHVYAVNEDGDVPEKRTFCEANGIEYVVLKRTPKPGLAQRSSTALRASRG